MKIHSLGIDANTLSHELKTPLAGILGMAELLSDEELSTVQKAQIAIIQQAGNRLLAFVDKLLHDFSELQ